jgi:RNA polymerase sigma factor (sigma-70 family)
MSRSDLSPPDPSPSEAGKHGAFLTTHWSLVLAAAQDSPTGEAALEQLCQNYWPPVYAFVRRRGSSPADAEDLTQAFFAHLLAKDALAKVERQKGKFRSFLLAALTHFLTNEWAKTQTRKRGGDRQITSLDDDTGEALYRQEPADTLSPERLFDRRWALTLIARALDGLRQEYAAAGKAALFARIEPGLTDEVAPAAYAQWGAELDMNEGAVRVALHRLRRRFGDALRAEVAQAVSRPEEIEEEIRHLLAAVAHR